MKNKKNRVQISIYGLYRIQNPSTNHDDRGKRKKNESKRGILYDDTKTQNKLIN